MPFALLLLGVGLGWWLFGRRDAESNASTDTGQLRESTQAENIAVKAPAIGYPDSAFAVRLAYRAFELVEKEEIILYEAPRASLDEDYTPSPPQYQTVHSYPRWTNPREAPGLKELAPQEIAQFQAEAGLSQTAALDDATVRDLYGTYVAALERAEAAQKAQYEAERQRVFTRVEGPPSPPTAPPGLNTLIERIEHLGEHFTEGK